MAPSNKHLMIFVLVTLTVLQTSAATDREDAESKTRPQFFFPLFPCTPGFPRWLLPCYDPPPMRKTKECWTPLMKVLPPCAEYLTNASISAPSGTCCDRFNDLVDDDGMCLCHVMNGDIDKLLPAPLNFTQLFTITKLCNSEISLKLFSHCSKDDMPPMTPPSGSPPSTSTEKAPPMT